MSEVSAEFSVGGGEAANPDWLAGIMVSTVIQFEATEEGTYTIEHEVDGSSASLPIHIVLSPAGP